MITADEQRQINEILERLRSTYIGKTAKVTKDKPASGVAKDRLVEIVTLHLDNQRVLFTAIVLPERNKMRTYFMADELELVTEG